MYSVVIYRDHTGIRFRLTSYSSYSDPLSRCKCPTSRNSESLPSRKNFGSSSRIWGCTSSTMNLTGQSKAGGFDFWATEALQDSFPGCAGELMTRLDARSSWVSESRVEPEAWLSWQKNAPTSGLLAQCTTLWGTPSCTYHKHAPAMCARLLHRGVHLGPEPWRAIYPLEPP